jgi:hypothetical protein
MDLRIWDTLPSSIPSQPTDVACAIDLDPILKVLFLVITKTVVILGLGAWVPSF